MNSEIYFDIGKCNLGYVLVAQSNQGICSILLGESSDDVTQELQKCFPSVKLTKSKSRLKNAISDIVQYVNNQKVNLDLKLDIRGTEFQQRVWDAISKIPLGSTASYAEIASKINSPNSVRAVANACASNVLAVVIPCHRVVRSNGDLSDYRWDLERKQKLLKKEANIEK